jgi:V8-like Glu-specific endopeptidase
LSASACAVSIEPEVAGAVQPLIYDADDRQDAYEIDSPVLRNLARDSTVALVDASFPIVPEDLEQRALGETRQLCPSERFADQPVFARCSGVVIDDDLIVTAGHCVDAASPCERQVWAFGYAVDPDTGSAQLRARDLYRCRSIPVAFQPKIDAESRPDYAVVQLDRPVLGSGHPARIASDALELGASVNVIGYPNGLPVKIDCGARVLDRSDDGIRRDYGLTSDTYAGSSGAAVIDERDQVAAIVVRGGQDYEYDATAHCWASRQVFGAQIDRAHLERAIEVLPAIHELCASGWPSSMLCGRTGACGDRQCAADEHESCVADCPKIEPPELPGMKKGAGCNIEERREPTTLHVAVLLSVVCYLHRRRIKR